MKIEIDFNNRASLHKLLNELKTATATVETAMRGFQEQGPSFALEITNDESTLFASLEKTFIISHITNTGMVKWKAKELIKKWISKGTVRVKTQGKPGVATIYEKI